MLLLPLRLATANCGTLMGPTSLDNFSSQNVANDLDMIDLIETTIRTHVIVLLGQLGTLIVSIRRGLHNRSRLSRVDGDQIFDTNFAIFNVLCASTRELSFQCVRGEQMIGPSVLLWTEYT